MPMKLADKWRARVAKLPPGLTQYQAAKRLRGKTNAIRIWLLKFGYEFKDGRTLGWSKQRRKAQSKILPDKVDWTKSNIQIAKTHGVSRERVRQIRERLGLEKVGGRK